MYQMPELMGDHIEPIDRSTMLALSVVSTMPLNWLLYSFIVDSVGRKLIPFG